MVIVDTSVWIGQNDRLPDRNLLPPSGAFVAGRPDRPSDYTEGKGPYSFCNKSVMIHVSEVALKMA